MQRFYFLDESGDPEFFGKRGKRLWEFEGWNEVLIMGLMETDNRKNLRSDIINFHESILDDTYYEGICSLSKEGHFFHARADHQEIRSAFFQFLRRRKDFRCYFHIVIKNPDLFINKFNKQAGKFYYYVVEKLLALPEYKSDDSHMFYLSRRTKATNEDFDRVIKSALNIEMGQEDLVYSCDVVKSCEFPKLCIVDYMLWALQRYLVRGESRFLKAVADKVAGISDGNKMKLTIEDILKKYKSPQYRA